MHRLIPCLLLALPAIALAGPVQDRWWSDPVEASLTRSAEARDGWVTALRSAPKEHREGLAFLIEHMREADLRDLSPVLVLENVALAYGVRAQVPWGADLPDEVFLNDVLPHANVTEARDRWRPKFVEDFLPLVAECKTPGEAAQVLNQKVFGQVGLRYSTERRAPDQGPFESIETGVASCSGLSIVLSDACRAVGVPARLAGIASWPNKRGNHTWVEVWDDGGWHFVGAAEPDGRGLNHGWFSGDAAQAKAGSRANGIWAVSYRRTEHAFPMVWAPGVKDIYAVEVTPRYTGALAAPDPARCRLLVRVVDPAGNRVLRAVRCVAADDEALQWKGRSRDEGADLNDILAFEVPPGREYHLQFGIGHGWRTVKKVDVLEDADQLEVTLVIEDAEDADLRLRLEAWFAAEGDARRAVEFTPHQRLRLVTHPQDVRRLAFAAWKSHGRHGSTAEEHAARVVKWNGQEAPYTLERVGERPADGWPLVIALHGGGGVPKEFNDSQWRHMQIYYEDHPEVGGYLYLALRAPNDNWNGFYDDSICGVVRQLIRNLVVFEDVDPDRVSIVGYSHGGYGAFVIGPKMPDRFAAIHASASAQSGGESAAPNLRNVRFTFMCGERDTAYGRIERCREFAQTLAELRGDDDTIFPGGFREIAGNGHGGLPDRDMTAELVPQVRSVSPKHLTWHLTDGLLQDHYWLHVPEPGNGVLEARIEGNAITVSATGPASVVLLLDESLVDTSQQISVSRGDRTASQLATPSLEVLCASLERLGDPRLARTVRIEVPSSSAGER